MLIPLSPDLIVSTDAIRSIAPVATYSDGLERIEITFTDGSRKVVRGTIESLEWCLGPIVPAPAGYSIVIAFPPERDGEATTFTSAPVIAFRLTDHEPYPITPWGRLGDHNWALVWPDGRADEQWNRIWPSVEEFKAAFEPRGERS